MPLQFLTGAESGAATIAPVLLRLFRHALSSDLILLRHDGRSSGPLGKLNIHLPMETTVVDIPTRIAAARGKPSLVKF